MSRNPTLGQLLNDAAESALEGMYVSLPGKVVRYDATTQEADVQPIPKDRHVDENGAPVVQALPVVTSVPVIFPGGGGFTLTFPIAVGDLVELQFCGLSIDKWLHTGSENAVDPEFYARHGLSDAVCFPGLRNFKRPRPTPASNAAVLGAETGAQIHVTSNAIKLGGPTAVQALVLGTAYRAAEDTLITALAAFATLVGADTNVLPATKAGGSTLVTAIGAFQSAALSLGGFLSTVSKTS